MNLPKMLSRKDVRPKGEVYRIRRKDDWPEDETHPVHSMAFNVSSAFVGKIKVR